MQSSINSIEESSKKFMGESHVVLCRRMMFIKAAQDGTHTCSLSLIWYWFFVIWCLDYLSFGNVEKKIWGILLYVTVFLRWYNFCKGYKQTQEDKWSSPTLDKKGVQVRRNDF